MDENVDKLGSYRELKAAQATQELIDSEIFQADVVAIRKRWFIPDGGFTDKASVLDWLKAVASKGLPGSITEDIKNTFIQNPKYGLTERALWALRTYITNNEYYIFSAIMPQINTWYDEDQEETVVSLQFFEHTTETEILEVFRQYKSRLPPVKPLHGLAARKHAKMRMSYMLKKDGLGPKQIADLLNAEFGGTDSYSDVVRYVREYKKRLVK